MAIAADAADIFGGWGTTAEKAAERAGVTPKKCMVLEDSHNGLRAANKAEMVPVMIPDLLKSNDEIEKIIYKNLDTLEYVIELLEI